MDSSEGDVTLLLGEIYNTQIYGFGFPHYNVRRRE
jgi:hypothetical protein